MYVCMYISSLECSRNLVKLDTLLAHLVEQIHRGRNYGGNQKNLCKIMAGYQNCMPSTQCHTLMIMAGIRGLFVYIYIYAYIHAC